MAYSEQFTCDICRKVRGPENHWFQADPRGDSFAVRTWSTVHSAMPHTLHYCGLECLTKALAKWTDESKGGAQ